MWKVKLEKFLFILLILLLPTQIGKHFFPDFAYIYSLKIDYFSPTLYVWDILVIGLLIIWFLQRPKINKTALTLFSVFLLTQLFSFFTAQNIGAAIVRLEQYIVCFGFGFYIASKNPDFIINILKKYLAIPILFSAILSFLQIILGKSIGFYILGERSFDLSIPTIAKFNWKGMIFLRPYATFPHPNVLGGCLVILMPLLFYFREGFINKLAILVSGITIFLSFSRVATSVFLVEIFLFVKYFFEVLKKYKNDFRLQFLVLLFLFFTPLLTVRFTSAFNFDQLSYIQREELAEVSIIGFLKSPYFGIGLNNFIAETASSTLISGQSRFLQPVHNIFLLVLSETGVLGLLGFFVLLFFPIYLLIKKRDNFFSKILFVSWLAVFLLGFFDHYVLTLAQGQRVFFMIWGLSLMKKNL